jgi:hypothetical protein
MFGSELPHLLPISAGFSPEFSRIGASGKNPASHRRPRLEKVA